MSQSGNLLAVSDLHVGFAENREIVRSLTPLTDRDWLLVAGDVAERIEDIEWALSVLSSTFARVVWTPGNHELWTTSGDSVRLRGDERYRHIVDICGNLGVLTPEDPYPVWNGNGGPVTVAPLFLLYDYSFRPEGARTTEEALSVAQEAGVVCSDEYLLHPNPHPTRDDWCRQRVAHTSERLAALEGAATVLINHWPLVREPTKVLRYPEFAQWCGTELTADWHVRFNAVAVIYGHLHIPRTTHYDGVRFEEVSIGYPREWRIRQHKRPLWLRRVLPERAAQ